MRRDSDGTWRIRADARVRVVLTMVAPSVRYHVALVDPLPTGLEPLNSELRGTGFVDAPVAVTPGGGRGGLRFPPGRAGPPLRPERAVSAPAAGVTTGVAGRIPPPWQRRWFEHQNLRHDRAEAFASLLPAGVYEYSYLARHHAGTFTTGPPRAEMMYEQETFGRGEGEVVVVGR